MHIRGSRNGTGDLTIAWARRTRFSGGLNDDIGTVPLNEEREEYAFDILDEAGGVALTIEGIITLLHTLSEAEARRHRAGAGCWYGADNERLDEGEPERTVFVDRLYIETHTPTVRDRLVKAGVRLGGLLNRALGDWPGGAGRPCPSEALRQ